MNLVIRKIKQEDLRPIYDFRSSYIDMSFEQFTSYFNANSNYWFIAYDNAILLGYCLGKKGINIKTYMEIDEIATNVNQSEKYVRKGIGTKLIKAFEIEVWKHGFEIIGFGSGENFKTEQFYLKNNYKPIEVVAFGDKEELERVKINSYQEGKVIQENLNKKYNAKTVIFIFEKYKKSKILEIEIPEYNLESKPNYESIGKKVDKLIEANFGDGKYILRAIGSQDHQEKTLDELAEIIVKTGTDKYDPNRKAVCHDEFSGYDYDIQAGILEISNGKIVIPNDYKYKSEFADIIWHFFEHTIFDRGFSVRIDLLLIYDITKLKLAEKFSPDSLDVREGLESYLYKFIDQENKNDALLGIVKIR
jgi:GNAT superfamily N-acetyltransferase